MFKFNKTPKPTMKWVNRLLKEITTHEETKRVLETKLAAAGNKIHALNVQQNLDNSIALDNCDARRRLSGEYTVLKGQYTVLDNESTKTIEALTAKIAELIKINAQLSVTVGVKHV